MRVLWVALCAAAMGSQPVAGELTAEVRVVDGSPLLFVDGHPATPLMFFGWAREASPTVVQVTPEWQQYHVSFAAPETNDGACGVHIRMASGPGILWIDDARFYEGDFRADAVNQQIACGDWECDRSQAEDAWKLFVKKESGADARWEFDSASPAEGNQSARVTIDAPGKDMWHVHFYQTGLHVEKGKRYTFSVWLRSDQARQAEIMALHHGGPWTIYSGGDDSVFLNQVRLAAEAGVHIHSFGLGMPWPRPGEPADFSAIDRVIEPILQADPEALLLPRFGCEPPGWWYEEHPDDALQYDDGLAQSISVASEAWRAEMAQHLAEFVTYCESKYGDHMLGYHPCGQHTGEWFYPRTWEGRQCGFDGAMRKGYAAWLRGKYGDTDALRAAWNDPEADFESVRAPTVEQRNTASLGLFRDPAKERAVIDFHEYLQVAMVEPLEIMARAIKDASQRRKLVVLFYGYYFELSGLPKGPQTGGHLALDRLLDCPDADIVCSPISYLDRGTGGMGAFMTAVDSVRARGKLWLNEDDTRTYLTPADSGYGRVDTPQETAWVHARNFGHLLPRRLACWYMDLGGSGWLNGEDIWETIAGLRTVYDAHLAKPATFAPEVALVIDEKSPCYMACDSALFRPLSSQFRTELYRMGVPFSIHLLDDLVAKRMPLAKATLFVGCFHLDDGQRAAITEYLQGRTAVWFYGSGFLGEGAAAAQMSATIGMPAREVSPPQPAMATLLDGTPLTAGVAGTPFGTDSALMPLWAVDESSGVTALARFADGSVAAATARRPDGGVSVYIGTVSAPAGLLRNILRESGAHIYIETNDVFTADQGFLGITASSAGHKSIRLPRACRVLSLPDMTGIASSTERIELDMALGETRLFRLE